MSSQKKGFVSLLQEFSIPLIGGVFAALVAANLWPEWYLYVFGAHHEAWHFPGNITVLGHGLTPYFLINDVFMVFFFGIAAKEITESCLPGGSLNPMRKALNPLFATAGGVLGPVGVFFGALWLATQMGAFGEGADMPALQRGWGIPTATDIALAWLVARAVFGKGHPAINFLLLLAVADDAIGLGIIAIFYGDPENPARPMFLLLVLAGMLVAFGMRKANIKSWIPYIGVAGPLAWCGLILAHLHPALALVFIVPFLPGPKRDIGMFAEQDEIDKMGEATAADLEMEHSALHNFEHHLKFFVDFGLFFFAMGNAGVLLGGMGPMTWIILGSLVVGKTIGVSAFAWVATKIGFPLPDRMGMREVAMAGFVAALGLTVALFVSGAAFPTDLALQGEAKMGALMSGFVGIVAIVIARALGMGKAKKAEHDTASTGSIEPFSAPLADAPAVASAPDGGGDPTSSAKARAVPASDLASARADEPMRD
jgi:NhaA family Na+:H+ antiporter